MVFVSHCLAYFTYVTLELSFKLLLSVSLSVKWGYRINLCLLQ